MPDPVLIVIAMSVALVVAGLLSALIGWFGKGTRVSGVGWSLGIGAGFFLGCWVLDIRPHWPPRVDHDRLLGLVLPAVLVVELLAAFPQAPRLLIWPLRLALVAGGARVLLDGTSYINDLAGPGTREWSPLLTWLIFAGLAALEGAVWALLTLLAGRAPGLSLMVCLAVTSAGAAVTVMLSGYATGGQIGLPLAAAIIGATAVALVATRTAQGTGMGPLGIPIVGLFSLLVIGRFFGELTSVYAILLFCAPLLGWLPELPYARRLPSWARGLARVALVSALVSAILFRARTEFDRDFQSPAAANQNEPSVQDYLDFGK